MKSKTITLNTDRDIDATMPAYITQTANKYQSKIRIVESDKRMDAKSLMSMMVWISSGKAAVTVETEGPDEEEAMGAVLEILEGK